MPPLLCSGAFGLMHCYMGSYVNGSDIQSTLEILVLAETLQVEKANNTQNVAIPVKINCCLFQDGKYSM